MAECANYGCGCGSAPAPAPAAPPAAQYGCGGCGGAGAGGACHAYGGHIVPRVSVMNAKLHRAAGKVRRARKAVGKAHKARSHGKRHGKSSW